jgi:DNA-binding CsgD family transcriptional regulator
VSTPTVAPPGLAAPTRPAPGGRGWAYAGTVLGAVTSVAANIADAYVAPKTWHPTHPGQTWSPDLGAVLGSVFWPLALLVASETLARKRWAGSRSRAVGVGAVLLVALVAAVISYQHLHGLLQHYQETDLSAALGPLAVDGLMIVCSLALVSADAPAGRLEPDASTVHPVPSSPTVDATADAPADTASAPGARPLRTTARPAARPAATGKTGAGTGTAAKVARLKAKHPHITQTEIAQRLGLSERTVRRHLNATPTGTDPGGHAPIPTLPTTDPTSTTRTETEPGDDQSQAA